jgi:anaerobic magnesium-protoporphyrin IX monomethyl ester cyclase
MKALLFNCPYTHRDFNENLDYVDADFGVFPPLDLCWAKSLLQQAGHQAKVVDIRAARFSREKVVRIAEGYSADIFCFTVHSLYNFFEVLEWVRYLKNKFRKPVLVSGYAVRTHYREIMQYPEFDYMVIGSAYQVVSSLFDRLAGKQELSGLKGIAYRCGKDVIFQLPGNFAERIDLLPIPDRSDLDNSKYYSIISKYSNFTIMLASFGCPFQCNYCAINHLPYSLRKGKDVVREIKECVNRYKIREIDFFDATFTADRRFVMELCQGILSEKISVKWSCRTTITTVDDELLALMARAGCYKIYYGIESCKQSTLDQVRKPIEVELAEEVLRLTREHGISTLGFFMFGLPGETKEDMLATIRYAKKLPLDYAQFSIMIAKPNTAAEKEMLNEDKDFWKDFILGKEKERRIETPWCTVPYPEIESLTRQAYKEFYFRPAMILRQVLSIRSFSEFWRYVKVVLKAIY